MEKKLDLILDKIGSILDRLDHQDETLEKHSRILESHSQILEKHSQILESHSQMLESHENLLHQLIKNVAATNVKVNEIEKKLEKNTQDIEEIKNSLVTKDDLKYYDQKIAEHDREIMKIKLS